MKRSPRQGWTLMRLVDGVLRVVATGDRDDLQARSEGIIRGTAGEPSLYGAAAEGRGVALYDAHGQLRDAFPHAPKLTTGGRMRWPATKPDDGTIAVRWVPPPMDPETKRIMDSLHPRKAPAGPSTGGDW